MSANQQVVLLLNEVPNQPPTGSPAAYMFKAKPRETDTHSVVFPIRDVKGGEYFVRVQVDSAESLLKVDTDPESQTFDRYIGPKVAIA